MKQNGKLPSEGSLYPMPLFSTSLHHSVGNKSLSPGDATEETRETAMKVSPSVIEIIVTFGTVRRAESMG